MRLDPQASAAEIGSAKVADCPHVQCHDTVDDLAAQRRRLARAAHRAAGAVTRSRFGASKGVRNPLGAVNRQRSLHYELILSHSETGPIAAERKLCRPWAKHPISATNFTNKLCCIGWLHSGTAGEYRAPSSEGHWVERSSTTAPNFRPRSLKYCV